MFVPSFFGSKRNYVIFLLGLAITGIIFMIIAISVTVNIFQWESAKRMSSVVFNLTLADTGESHISKNDVLEHLYESEDKLAILISFNSIDLASLTIKANVLLTMMNGYASEQNTFLSSKNMTIGIGQEMRQIVADQPFTGYDVPVSLTGDLSQYPYDVYITQIYITAAIKEKDIEGGGILYLGASTGIFVTGSVPGLKMTKVDVVPFSPGVMELSLSMQRSTITRGFSVFIISLMWVLSVMILMVALDIIFRGREVAGPVLAFPVASIFALPALRNLQPGIPSVGALADIMGFYWNMIFIAVSALCVGFTFIFRYRDNRQTKSHVDMSGFHLPIFQIKPKIRNSESDLEPI